MKLPSKEDLKIIAGVVAFFAVLIALAVGGVWWQWVKFKAYMNMAGG